MSDPTQPSAKSAENRPLRLTLYSLMVLYVCITAWLIYHNETISTTQLGYSTLHADQLKELQSGMVDLIKAVELTRQQERIGSAIVDSRLEVLEKKSKQIGEVLQSTANADQQRIMSLGATLAELDKQAGAISQNLEGLKTDQQRVAATLNTQLGQLQQELANQREQVATALRGDIAQIRGELAQAMKTSASQNRQQLLAGLADETLVRARSFGRLDETNLAAGWEAWRQADLWAAALQSDPALAPRAQALADQSAALRKNLTAAVAAAIAKYNRLAMTATTADGAQAALGKAGELFQFFPTDPDPSAQQIRHNLHLAHEAVRQRLANP